MCKILIVEDEAIVAEQISDLLTERGYTVVGIAADERSALRSAAEERPDLVLMDIRLANQDDGIEVARRIRAKEQVPVLFVSASLDRSVRDRAAALGCSAFLQKPFSSRELLASISALAA